MTNEDCSLHQDLNAPRLSTHWEGFAFRKFAGTLLYHPYLSIETRNQSTFQLIFKGLARYPSPDFDWILVNTSDRDDFPWLTARSAGQGWIRGDDGRLHRCFSTCYASGGPNSAADSGPDFVYDHWKQTGLDDFEAACAAVQSIGPPQTPMLGWRGATTHSGRKALVALDDKVSFDCEFIHWDRTNPHRLTASNFLSFEEQVSRWRFLIDVEGNGYSGRLKLLLRCPRVVFIQERRYREDFFIHLVPWLHYVPVRNDFADLAENLMRLRTDPGLEQLILDAAKAFSNSFLTRSAAERRWAYLIKRHLAAPKFCPI